MAGNTASVTHSYAVFTYVFCDWGAPFSLSSKDFKKTSTIPVKFQLRDANGAFVANAVANLFLSKVSTGLEGTQLVALSTSKADAGNQFRYDPASNQYIFNLGTSAMSVGTWRLKILLNDGKSYVVDISIKK